MTESILHGRRIRGLTLWRPWPWAFTHADKRVENRPWPAPRWIVGGYVALHAGKTFDKDAARDMHDHCYTAAADNVPTDPAAHPDSVIVAVARVTGCHVHIGAPPKGTEPIPWAFGPYVWELPDVVTLGEPVPCRGAQGLWKLPPDVLERVAAQMPAPSGAT